MKGWWLPLGKFRHPDHRRDSREGSSCSDHRSRLRTQGGNIPTQSSTCRTRRCSSKCCPQRTSSSHRTGLGALREEMVGMARVWEGSDPSWWGTRLQWQFHTCHSRMKQPNSAPSWCSHSLPSLIPKSSSQSSSPYRPLCRNQRRPRRDLVVFHSVQWKHPEWTKGNQHWFINFLKRLS